MVRATLIAKTDVPPVPLSSHAAETCYKPEMPKLGDAPINIEKRLFNPGHHTTLEHNYFTFALEDISISTITFGFHLNHPFYNSDQRSGRFSKMYDNPNMAEIELRLKHYFPNENSYSALKFIESGMNIFQKNKDVLTDVAAQSLREERPFVSDKYIEQNAKKMAQEQLRVFASTIMPTAMDHTINLIALCALWRVAWSPEMREATGQMKAAVVKEYPDVAYMFDESAKSVKDWNPEMCDNKNWIVKTSPVQDIIDMDISDFPCAPNSDSVDILHFSPESMNNNVDSVRTSVEMSVMTMGQDQRHRTIHRGRPAFSGNFYLPPLLVKAGLMTDAEKFWAGYKNLDLGPSMKTMIAPYGAMVDYTKKIQMNALLHEQAKRLCWCAQEEIYNLNTQLVQSLQRKAAGDNKIQKLVSLMLPACKRDGKCIEGVRYCGRNMKMPVAEYFKQRSI